MIETHALDGFAARLRARILNRTPISDHEFSDLAIELFHLQQRQNPAYQTLCKRRNLHGIVDWPDIPAMPAEAFKDLEVSCIPCPDRTSVFFSSGTTEQRPSRHFHNRSSLAVYEASALAWFRTNLLTGSIVPIASTLQSAGVHTSPAIRAVALTPSAAQAPNSSLVHMFDALRQNLGLSRFDFTGKSDPTGAWHLDCPTTVAMLEEAVQTKMPVLLLGTAFSFVHLLDYLAETGQSLALPAGSCVMETGGYKGRSRVLTKTELHELIITSLGVPSPHIVCEYGMSELSSQAYDRVISMEFSSEESLADEIQLRNVSGRFRFPPWARYQIISPETGRAVTEGQTGLVRVFDLANVYSALAIQTQDLAIKRSKGFELIGRASLAENRGCSLMTLQG